LGYEFGEPVFDPAQNVNLQLCTHASHPAVEIIWPGDTASPVDKLANRYSSGVIYHVCYETDDLKAALAELEAAGLQPLCIWPATPAPLFGGRPVSSYNILGMGLVEILEP
jgi:methylmalonyl-CoA/ethylmalonyl-CoA epimerase